MNERRPPHDEPNLEGYVIESDDGGYNGVNEIEVLAIGKGLSRPPTMKKKCVAVFGPKGAGKSQLVGLVTGYIDKSYCGWRGDGTKVITHYQIRLGADKNASCVDLFDLIGFSGKWKEDMTNFHHLVDFLRIHVANVGICIVCLTATRFGIVETSILDMIKLFLTAEMQAKIHIVITHCPEYVRTSPDFIKDVVTKLAMFGSTEEEILSRVTFVDLLDPRRFKEGSVARAEVEETWQQHQQQLFGVIERSDGCVSLTNFFSRTFWDEQRILYQSELVLTSLSLMVIISLYLIAHYHGDSKEKLQVIQKCLKDNAGLIKDMEDERNRKPTVEDWPWF